MKWFLAIVLAAVTVPALAQEQGDSALLFASSGTASYIQGAVGSAGGATAATAAAMTVTSGDLIVVASKTQNNNPGAVLAVSSAGVTCTWAHTTPIDNFGAGTFTAALAWCVVSANGSMTVTASWSSVGGAQFTDLGVAEFRSSTGFAATPLDVSTQSAVTTSGTTCSAGPSAATSNANDLVVGVCENFNAAQSYGAASPGYTLEAASSRNTLGFYSKSVTATGTQSISTTVASDQATAMVAAFKLN